ncbi:DUF2971 domain-containing protein, partial [Mesorhizobium sp. M2A.F.Ca.ET.037.01.1.1]
PGDRIVDAMLSPSGKTTADLYRLLDETIAKFALISFTGTCEALPLWAYYANNFAGMCLEFDTRRLFVSDFQGEKLREVTYARHAAPSLSLNDFGPGRLDEAIISRISRKRIEWAHEKEWRFVTGTVGSKHYLDDALRRVYLGPRIDPVHATRVCDVLKRRPVEVLQGKVRGFELEFHKLQGPAPLVDCERVGAGRFSPADDLYAEPELRGFFGASYDKLLEECRTTALRPNMEQLAGIDISGVKRDVVYFHTTFKLRNGREVYEKRYFNKQMELIEGDAA